MGDDISTRTFTREQRLEYRHKVRRCLDVFAENSAFVCRARAKSMIREWPVYLQTSHGH